jgi:hypothetical protein
MAHNTPAIAATTLISTSVKPIANKSYDLHIFPFKLLRKNHGKLAR